jgi:hypothetical protein
MLLQRMFKKPRRLNSPGAGLCLRKISMFSPFEFLRS